MRINLTTPLSDDKERQRRNEVILAAIERHTEKHMNDDHTATSQPAQSDVNERLGAWLSAALDDPNCSDAFKQDINDWFANQPTQSDALREALVDLLHAVCGKTGFAETVRRDSGRIYPWPALDLAEAKALEALEQSK